MIVPHARYLLPHEGIPQALAATYTCSGITALSALKKTRAHLGSDDHLVIIGAGGVGGSAVHIAPAAVAGKVIVADIDAQKRAQARQMGAVATIDNAAPDAVKQVMEATGGGAAAAIDFVGSPKTMEFGVNILRKGGKLVMVGLYGGAHPISTVLFPFKMMTIEGSYVGTLEDLRELLALARAGKVPPIPIETRPADQASAALSDLKSGGKVRGRVVLHHSPGRGVKRCIGCGSSSSGSSRVRSPNGSCQDRTGSSSRPCSASSARSLPPGSGKRSAGMGRVRAPGSSARSLARC